MTGVKYVGLFHHIFELIQSVLWFPCRLFCMDFSILLTSSSGFQSKHFEFLQTFAQIFCPTFIALSNICLTGVSWSVVEILPQLRQRVGLGLVEFWMDRCCGYVTSNELQHSHCLWLTVYTDVSAVRNWLCFSVSILTAKSIASCGSRLGLRNSALRAIETVDSKPLQANWKLAGLNLHCAIFFAFLNKLSFPALKTDCSFDLTIRCYVQRIRNNRKSIFLVLFI